MLFVSFSQTLAAEAMCVCRCLTHVVLHTDLRLAVLPAQAVGHVVVTNACADTVF